MKHFLTALLLAGVATAANAGGPIYTYDPVNRIPYAWDMASWPNGQVPVYTDLGDLGHLTNERADELVAFSTNEWSNVQTSSFRATVAGDFTALDLGLGDIDASTITSIIGAWDGGGIDVVYDHDGTILSDFFGLPPTGVLGITNIDFVDPDSEEITEAWMVLSGPGIHAADPDGIGFQGVVTHELGHALNLAHSQVNGAVWNPNVYDSPQPQDCGAPWTGGASSGQVETMYPISFPEPGESGEYMATVDLDDMTALSDLYPAPGYPENKGTIKGQVLDANGAPVMGVDVIARNVAYPFDDCTSYISGQITKGDAGPDGSFELNNLTPGGRYAIYIDNLLVGAFSVPRLVVLPGAEEYFNGRMEGGDAAQDKKCAWTTVVATPGAPVTANIIFNKYAGAPTLTISPYIGYPIDITPDGYVVVGALSSIDGPIFRWDLNSGEFENIGGFRVGLPSISDDGTKIASTVEDTDGIIRAAVYENGVWNVIPPAPGSSPCDQDGKVVANAAYDISGDGSTVVGMNYGDHCFRSGVRAFKWTAAGGSVVLPKSGAFNNLSRANGVNYDGSVIVGHDENTSGQWRGALWKDGVVKLISRLGQNVSPALDVSRDGQYVVGQSSVASSQKGWRYSVASNTVELLGALPSYDNNITSAISDDHNVITGVSTSNATGGTSPIIWTPGLKWTNFNTFLAAQGVNFTDAYPYSPAAMSADGRVITGTLASIFGDVGFVLKTPTSIVCHAPASSPTQLQTTIVGFPQGLDEALLAGDTLGPCQCNSAAPTGIPKITIGKPAAGNARVYWSATASATGYDLARGGLELLRSSNGNFSMAATDCLENDLTGTSRDDADTPYDGDGFWYLVRAANCGGSATFDSGAPSQIASRDAGMQASSSTCP